MSRGRETPRRVAVAPHMTGKERPMATLTETRSAVRFRREARVTEDWVGRVPYLLAIALALDTGAAATTALLFREAIRGPEVSIGSCSPC
jgi:hypothetical protein